MTTNTLKSAHVTSLWSQLKRIALHSDELNPNNPSWYKLLQAINPIAQLWRGTVAPPKFRVNTKNGFRTTYYGKNFFLGLAAANVFTIGGIVYMADIIIGEHKADTATTALSKSIPWRVGDSEGFVVRASSPLLGRDLTKLVVFSDWAKAAGTDTGHEITLHCRTVYSGYAEKISDGTYAKLNPNMSRNRQLSNVRTDCPMPS